MNFRTGEICLDLLRGGNDGGGGGSGSGSGKGAWSAVYTIQSTVLAVGHLLAYPEVDSPLNVDVAVLLRGGDTVGAESLVRWACGVWRWERDG